MVSSIRRARDNGPCLVDFHISFIRVLAGMKNTLDMFPVTSNSSVLNDNVACKNFKIFNI